MIYRWLYKLWKYFWITVGVVFFTALILSSVAILLLQLPQTKDYLKNEVVETFNSQYEGTLEIESISGFLPFKAGVNQGKIFAPSDSLNPVLSFERAEATVNWWELLQQNLAISSFEVYSPSILFDRTDGNFNFGQAVRQKEEFRRSGLLNPDAPELIGELNIFAPSLSIIDGEIRVERSIEMPQGLEIRTPFTFQQVNANLFIELTESQIFVDILNISTVIPNSEYNFISTSGQFYSDSRFFELNNFRIRTGIGELEFGLEASPVNLFGENISAQFQAATYSTEFKNSFLSSSFIQRYIPDYPDFEENLFFELIAEGTADEFFIDRFQAGINQSSLLFSATGRDLFQDSLSYEVQLENLVMNPNDLMFITKSVLPDVDLTDYQISTVRGNIAGTLNAMDTELMLRTSMGSLGFDASLLFNIDDQIDYEFLFESDSLDISPFLKDSVNSTLLNGSISAIGSGILENQEVSALINLDESILAGHRLRRLSGTVDLKQNRYDFSLNARDSLSTLQSAGFYSLNGSQHHFSADSRFSNLNLVPYTGFFDAVQTNFNGSFSANIRGSDLEDVWGRLSVEMDPSAIGSDSLRAHQLYADINQPENESRTLRFTSSFFDGEIAGTLSPSAISRMLKYWAGYLMERLDEEIFLANDLTLSQFLLSDSSEIMNEIQESENLELSLQINLKDLDLLRSYVKNLPEIQSRARLTSSVTADGNRIQLSGNLFDERFELNDLHVEDLSSSITVNVRHDMTLREYNLIDFQLSSSSAMVSNMEFSESFLNLTARNDSIEIRQQVLREDDIQLQSSLLGILTPGMFELEIHDFDFGSREYSWVTRGTPSLQFSADRKLTVTDLALSSDNDLIEVNGTFSTDIADSVEYNISNLDLARISNLINKRISFSGIMNGEFITRSLTQIPSIQGLIDIQEGRMNGRLLGDLSLNSTFNSEENQFDTEIRVYTDPEKYPGYITSNDGIGQDLRFNGYFRLPDNEEPDTELFYFDADLREIDMWIVTVIVPAIIADMDGRASGRGFIKGTRNDFDFEATFDASNVYGVPAFTNVEYVLDGEIDFNKTDGLLFRNVRLTDNDGGTGTLSGQVDLDNFSPTTYIDLTLDLNNLQFINNTFDPDIPFYGTLYGTGQARITGTNFSPYLRTSSPVLLSSNSRISVPLEEETEFEQDRRFIQFVESFEEALQNRESTGTDGASGNGETPPEDLTFLERFTMDLQFSANNPLNVQLIFDRVTNEILNTNGTGQIRLLLEDQDVSMFGRFNIVGGDYQFVSGDIFTRRFTLQEGGSISWQGDLVDANLNVTAVYRARPSISSLLGSAGDQQVGQRIPVELVLQIGGTISAVENNFFFRVPTGIEGTLDPTLATQINNLNQNEEEKLIQATSILLSGNFLPFSSTQGLGLEGVSGTAAVVNPLLTSQVINPLLSNQINSLLRSDITFDIDLNLTAFDEVDLGVALRLFDDRVILRREGQITGEQSDIGDLGATYRINRTFSITAFHRQDPTLIAREGNAATGNAQTQEMNGIGVEARFQFNTWKNFGNSIAGAFRKLFGVQRKDESDENVIRNVDSDGNTAAIN